MENPNTTKAKELFLQALAEASMCWDPRPSSQTYDPAEVNGIAEREFPKIEKLIEAGFAVKVSAMFRSAADELDGLAVELRKRGG